MKKQRPWENSWLTTWDRGGCYAALSAVIMSILSWNCRGFGNPRTVNTLKRALKKKTPICDFLMETKLITEQLNGMKQNWDYNHGLVVSCDGLKGGLALLWKPTTQVHVQNFSRWFIDAHIFCN